jgi:cell wall-associated NlpC family hydrolase
VRNTIQKRAHTVLEVTTKEYPSATPLYIDSRFVQTFRSSEAPSERKVQLPNKGTVIKNLREQIGKQYVWGGNTPGGVALLAKYFLSKIPLDARTQAKWTLDGFDCSGLLYWATNGYTPRNTSGLVDFGV